MSIHLFLCGFPVCTWKLKVLHVAEVEKLVKPLKQRCTYQYRFTCLRDCENGCILPSVAREKLCQSTSDFKWKPALQTGILESERHKHWSNARSRLVALWESRDLGTWPMLGIYWPLLLGLFYKIRLCSNSSNSGEVIHRKKTQLVSHAPNVVSTEKSTWKYTYFTSCLYYCLLNVLWLSSFCILISFTWWTGSSVRLTCGSQTHIM